MNKILTIEEVKRWSPNGIHNHDGVMIVAGCPACENYLAMWRQVEADLKASAPRSVTLPYPVSANRYWRSYAVKGRVVVARSPEAKLYRTEVGLLAQSVGIRQPLDGPIALTVRLYPKRPKDYAKRLRKEGAAWVESVQCIDLGNCEKVLSDALNGIAWHDDKQLHRITLIRCAPDEDGPRAVVVIEPMTTQETVP